VLEQFADHGRDGTGGGGSANGLQVAAGAKRAAFAFDHQHPDVVGSLDLGAERLEFLGDRKVDRIERGRAIKRDRGDRTFNPEQCRIVGKRGGELNGCRHL
jgi:hypothetical protein